MKSAKGYLFFLMNHPILPTLFGANPLSIQKAQKNFITPKVIPEKFYG